LDFSSPYGSSVEDGDFLPESMFLTFASPSIVAKFSSFSYIFLASASALLSYHFVISSFKGIKGMIKNPKKLVAKPTKQRFLYFERSSAVTPTNFSFIQTPTIGAKTLFAKLVVPVKKAKTVPSIFAGVIFAKRAIVGRVFIARLTTPNMVSVQTIHTISLIPIILLNLNENAHYERDEIIENQVDQ
jgi:hypothetical protein